MPQTQITMGAKMSKKDADLMLAWLQMSLADYVTQGVELALERGRDTTTVTLTCDDDALLSDATDAFAALATTSSSAGET